MVDYQRYIDRIDEWITERPRTVVIAFVLLTIVFAGGLANISTDAGTSQFTEDSPAQAALDDIDQEFSPSFSEGNGSTQLIQSGSNVLAKDELLAMLEAQQRLEDHESQRVVSASSAAGIVAQTIDRTRRPSTHRSARSKTRRSRDRARSGRPPPAPASRDL